MALRAFLVLIVLVSSCSSDSSASRSVGTPTNDDAVSVQEAEQDDTTEEVVSTAAIGRPAETETDPLTAFNGRIVPPVASSAEEAAALFSEVREGLLVDEEDPLVHADLGHTEQLVIRQLLRNEEWVEPFRAALSPADLAIADLHLIARRELNALHSGSEPPTDIPAWTIIDPEPLGALIEHYQRAGEATGIEWQILAGMNLIETGMGRIQGLSSAGAQGPMQFLPSTWEEVSEGGDINDPGDAIDGAARYLVQRGGLDDIRAGLFGYNNSENYVNAVLAYAEMAKLDETTLRGFYNWEVYVGTDRGTVWLPVGYLSPEPVPANEYTDLNPWALTLD